MESLDPTLHSILLSLYQNNGRKSWNLYPESSGSICLKIRFNGQGVGSSVDSTKPKHKPESKIRRNMNRSNKWKETTLDSQCKSNPAKRNRLELSPDHDVLFEIENSRNCAEPFEKFQTSSLDDILPSVDCIPLKTPDHSPLVNCAEPITPLDASQLQIHDESDDQPFEECLSREIEINSGEINVDINNSFDPYDNENDSVYDENVFPDWRHIDRPCIKPGCFYRPSKTIEPSEVNTQLGHRPNGSFGSYYKCDLCGRIMCNECVYYKMRHLNHFKHVKAIYSKREPIPIDIDKIVKGII